MAYIWENKRWPELYWDDRGLAQLLSRVSREQGRLLGKMEGLGFDLRSEAHLSALTEDVVKSSEIEGEILAREQVRSSIARRLGMGFIAARKDIAETKAAIRPRPTLRLSRVFASSATVFPVTS